MALQFCIVGCGAPGSVFAAHLGRPQAIDVHAYEVSQEHTRAINQGGLRISVAAEFTVHVHATSDPQELPRCDFGIVATKGIGAM
jgi:2-dehydropantoate 2-reductase